MAGPLSSEQLKAIHAKNRPDVLKLQKNPQQISLRVNEGSLPEYERKYAGRIFSGIKRATGQRDAIHDAEVTKREAEEKKRQELLQEGRNKMEKERELRSKLADKKISFEDYLKELEKVNPRTAQGIKASLPSQDTKQKEGESDKDYEERMKIVKRRESQEKYFENTRGPSPLFPYGASSASRHYNAATGKEYYTSSISPAEQRALGVEKPVIEVPLDNLGNYISIPADKPPTYIKPEKPTANSVKEEQERNKKTSAPSSSDGSAEEFLGLFG